MDSLSTVLSIVVIDLVLSGDNAVIIGLAAHRLPPRQRRIAILVGGAAAIGLRIALTAAAAMLLSLPALKAIGGLLLLWIAFKLLRQEQEDADQPHMANTMRGAILTILVADFVMSLDNVLGVAAASQGEIGLLIFGLGLSMAILMLGGSLFAGLVNRFRWMAYLGAAVIAWTGGHLVLEDEIASRLLPLPDAAALPATAVVTAAVLAVAHYTRRRAPSEASYP
jgi:YjbE family integral membrane protein